jgi:capsular exopolysaccharide synthesis family protein
VRKAKDARDAVKALFDKAFETSGRNPTAPVVAELKEQLDKRQTEFDEAKKGATAEAVDVARAVDAANARGRVAALETQTEISKENREKVRLDRDAIQKAIDSSVGGGLNIEAMRKALQPQRDTLDKLNTYLAGLRVEKNLDNRPSLRGEVERVPYNNLNKKVLFSAVGGGATFLCVVLVVAFMEWRTRRVDGVDQVVNELGMRVIGTVPAFPNRANVKAAVEAGGANWRFVLNESINSTRTMLLHTARTQSMQVVMVTSATQGEGKTSLASQLATSMATAGMRTLLVDCDLRNPSVQKLFELPLAPGVSEVLRQEVDVSEAVQATAVPNLWVIPAGQCSAATIAALAQGQMETLFNRLRGSFDFILVDSCPVLPVADALLIGQHVDGVVFSIMQDISQLPKVMTALAKLAQLNIPLVGAVVNGIKQDVASYGYNYVKQLPA